MDKSVSREVDGLQLSAAVYLVCVIALTALGIAVAARFQPPLAHSIKEILGLEQRPSATRDSFYTARVAPVLQEHCTGCHGAHRQKGKLRLDSFAAVLRGGRHGAVIENGVAQRSELLSRITLPATDDRVMPPDGKPRLAPDEVKVIQLWIETGASGKLAAAAVKGAPAPVRQIHFAQIDEAAVRRQRAPLAAVVRQLQAQMPGLIAYESRGSADLTINASLSGSTFGDAQLGKLAPLANQIVWADFSGTDVSDVSAPTLALMRRLRVLRLTSTKVTDGVLSALKPLNKLESLTVVGVAMSDKSLAELRNKGVRIYDGQV